MVALHHEINFMRREFPKNIVAHIEIAVRKCCDEIVANTPVVNACYFTTAGLSLFSPPPLISRQTKGINSIKAHKALAYVHFTGMVLTNVLAPNRRDPTLRAVHRASAYTAFGAFLGAMVVMTF